MSKLFKSEFMVDGATVYNLKDSMWLGKPSKSNEWCFGVQNTDATDSERESVAKFIAHAINSHEAMQSRIVELEKALGNTCKETMTVSGHPDFALDNRLDLIYETALESLGVLVNE